MSFAGALQSWYRKHRRELPWRERPEPYAVLVSEVMAQQTRVATVIPYYRRWMERFPSLEVLARASESEVLACWEGLGYYRRARGLRRCAQQVMAEHHGELPRDSTALRKLPGIGPYTAAAVASIAFGERIVAVDGNVRRVAARYFGWTRPRDQEIAAHLGKWQPATQPGSFNEALMDLGAGVCRPRNPLCDRCPLAGGCVAHQLGAPERFPERQRRRAIPTRSRFALVCVDSDRVVLAQRPSDGLLGGLWGFPQTSERPCGATLEPVQQTYSHFHLKLTPVLVDRDVIGTLAPSATAIRTEELGSLPLSGVDRKILARLAEATGQEVPTRQAIQPERSRAKDLDRKI